MSDAFQRVVMEGLVPKIAQSYVAVALVPSNEENYVDAKFCTELGVMIMLDKPIIALVHPGMQIPKKLEQVADMVVVADLETDEGQALVHKALETIQERES